MTIPPALTGRYQLGLYGADSGEFDKLTNAVARAIEQLGVPPKQFLIPFGDRPDWQERAAIMPAVAVFFGSNPVQFSDKAAQDLAKLVDDGWLVIPIVPNKQKFACYVPEILQGIQGLTREECGQDFERLAARVLEGLGLLRERRRLFISYRRTESTGVAAQLYEALDMAGYDVFLDTHGAIAGGEPFQEILWHRLADTDVVVLLDTPGFLESRWTEAELARANTSNIQILQVLWPHQQEVAGAAFSAFHLLEEADFLTKDVFNSAAQLKNETISGIVDATEGLRARALAARQSFLVSEFFEEARKAGFKAARTLERNILLRRDGNDPILVIPAIGIPDAERYQDAETLYQRDRDHGVIRSKPTILLFDETGIRNKWLEHLGWLNQKLGFAQTISLRDARNYLNGLKGA